MLPAQMKMLPAQMKMLLAQMKSYLPRLNVTCPSHINNCCMPLMMPATGQVTLTWYLPSSKDNNNEVLLGACIHRPDAPRYLHLLVGRQQFFTACSSEGSKQSKELCFLLNFFSTLMSLSYITTSPSLFSYEARDREMVKQERHIVVGGVVTSCAGVARL